MLVVAVLDSDENMENVSVANEGNALGVTEGELEADVLVVAVTLVAAERELDGEALSLRVA